MSGVPDTNLDLEGKSLSLIDFCAEDDCLYASPPRDHQTLQIPDYQKKQKSVKFLDVQASEGSGRGDEQVIQLFESSGVKKTKKNEKYNLRKSLAWDNAFFTSAGVLEPEELSSMMWEAEQGEKRCGLPGIEEEICRSSESICTLATDKSASGTLEDDLFGDIRASIQKSSNSCKEIRKAENREEKLALTGIEEDMRRSNDSTSTLATDNSTLGTFEDDLFGDIRASIQKSSKASRTISQSKLASGVNASQLMKSSEKMGTVSQNKLMTKAALKKPSVVNKGSGKIVSKVAPSPEASKCGSRTGESASSLGKPPKLLARASSFSTIPTKRASLSNNSIKVVKDTAKTLTGRGAKVSANGASRYGVPKPLPPVKSSLRSSGSIKTQLTPSSSIDSFGSLSSNSSSSKHSSEIEKRKIDSKTGNYPSNSSTVRSTTGSTRTAQRNGSQSRSSHNSPHLKSLTKPSWASSSISPASSISEWSSASLSPTSTLNRSNISRPGFDMSSCKNASNKVDAFQASNAETHSNENYSVGNSTRITGLVNKSAKRGSTGSGAVNHPEAIKPSGLRLPSPKIGFFDGAKSMARTPTGTLKSPSAPCNLPRSRSANISPGRGSKEARPEKLQPARTAMPIRGTKAAVQKTTSETKPKSPLPLQETSNLSPKISSGSKSGKNHPGMPLKVQNKKSPEKHEQCNLNAENIATTESKTAISNPRFCDSERGNSPCKDKFSSLGQGNDSGKVEEIPTISEGFSATCKSSFTSVEEGEFCSQKSASKPAAEITPRSPFPLQEASNLSPKVFSGSKTGKHSPGMPLKVQNKKSPGKDEQSNLNAENIATKEYNTAMSNPDFCDSERKNSLCPDNVSSYVEGNDFGKVEDVPTIDGRSTAICNPTSTTEQEGELCSKKNDLKPASEIKPKSPFPLKEASDLSSKVFSGLKTGKHSPGMPVEAQNKKSPGKDEQCTLNAENITTKESNTAMSNPDFRSSDRSNSLCKDKLSSYGKGKDPEKVADIPTVGGGSSATCNSEIQPKSPFPLQKASNLSPKVFRSSKTGKHTSPGMPVEVRNKKSPGKDEQCNLNAENIATKESNTAMSNPDFRSSERNNSLCKDRMDSGNPEKVAEIPTVDRGSSAACNSSSTKEQEGEFCSRKNDLKPASEIKSKAPFPLQEASNLSPKVFSGSKTGKHTSPRMPVEVQNKKSPGKDEQCDLNAEEIATKESNTAISNPDFRDSERNNSLCKDRMGSYGAGNDYGQVDALTIDGRSSATCNSNSISMEGVESCTQKNDLNCSPNSSKEENVCGGGLARQVGAFDIHGEIQEKPADECCSLYQVDKSRVVVNPCIEAETVNLSMAAPSHTPLEAEKVADTDES